MESLLLKSGYNDKLDNIKNKIKLTKYESIKLEMTYDEYNKLK